MEQFKKVNSFEKRKEESCRICKKHSDRVPIVVCRNIKDDNIAEIDKQKFLVPKDMTIGQFVYVIRKRINLKSEQALFVLINNSLQPSNKLLEEIYKDCKDDDGFLYVIYSSENTFG